MLLRFVSLSQHVCVTQIDPKSVKMSSCKARSRSRASIAERMPEIRPHDGNH